MKHAQSNAVVQKGALKVALTVRDGRDTHDRYVSFGSPRELNRHTFSIARMLKRWQRNPRSAESSVLLELGSVQRRVRKSTDVRIMAHKIRKALSSMYREFA